ncbi:MAG: hypothetical protein RSD46_05920 [Oscillospiraceae bacterium]
MGEDNLDFLETALAEYPDFILSQGEDFPEEEPVDDDTEPDEDD